MKNAITIKKLFSNLFTLLGVHSIIEHYLLSNKAFILMYHRILPSLTNQPLHVQPGMFVSSTIFSEQISFLRDQFEVLFLEDLVEKVLKGGDIGRCCAITFDDGWRDNYTEAFPILCKYQVPATIFLASGYIGSERAFWPEELCYYLARCIETDFTFISAPVSVLTYKNEICSYYQYSSETFFDKAIEILKKYSHSNRIEILSYFKCIFRSDPVPRQMLSWDECREMLSSGFIRFGAHTANHEILDQLSIQMAQIEIDTSRDDIALQLKSNVDTFSYPNGNHSEWIRAILSESGFKAAVTTRKGFLDHDTPVMQIPRISIHEDVSKTVPMFRSRILLPKF